MQSVRGRGFIFAFKLYDPKGNSPYHAIERAVRVLTADDIIHVAVLPSVQDGADDDDPPAVCRTAFTAVVGTGFLEHPAEVCLDSSFVLLYVGMEHEEAAHGVRFLHTLRGKPYNYAALPLTILPHWLKGHTSACRGHPKVDLEPSHIFCSQMGLLLCHACNLFARRQDVIAQHEAQHMRGLCGGHDLELLDPACCTPGELYMLLVEVFQARAVHPCAVRVRADIASETLLAERDDRCCGGAAPTETLTLECSMVEGVATGGEWGRWVGG